MLDWDEIAKTSAATPSSDVDIERVIRRGGTLKRQRLLSVATLVALAAASSIGVLKASSSNESTLLPADDPSFDRSETRTEFRKERALLQARLDKLTHRLNYAMESLENVAPRSGKGAALREKSDAIREEIAELEARLIALLGHVDVSPNNEVVVLQEGTFDETWGIDAGKRWELRIWRAQPGECHQFAVGNQGLDQGVGCTVPVSGSGDVGSIGFTWGGEGSENDLGILLGSVSLRTNTVVAVNHDGERFDIAVHRATEPWRSSLGYYVAFLPPAAYFEIEAYSGSGELLQTRRLEFGGGGKAPSGVRCESSVGLAGCS